MIKKLASLLSLALCFIVPVITLADGIPGSEPSAINNINVNFIATFLSNVMDYVVWPIAVFAIIAAFLYAGVVFLTARGDPGKVGLARSIFLWGLAGAVVIFLAFSVIATVNNFLNPPFQLGTEGCTDSTADNYNPQATINDGSCTYGGTCKAINGNCNADSDCCGGASCVKGVCSDTGGGGNAVGACCIGTTCSVFRPRDGLTSGQVCSSTGGTGVDHGSYLGDGTICTPDPCQNKGF